MLQMKVLFSLAKGIINPACRLFDSGTVCQRVYSTSAFYFSKAREEAAEIVIKEKLEIKKSPVVKYKRPPFAKNFFLGVFDTHLLAFPEILDREGVVELEYVVQCINELYKNKVDSQKIIKERKIPEDVLEELKSMGLFGRLVPTEFGGLNFNYTSYSRSNEVLGGDLSITATLAAHELLGTQVLLIAGNEEQKAKYLPDLASGKRVAAVCWAESASGLDVNSISTKAIANSNGESFSLSGSKQWVTNGDIADIFIVFAKSQKFLEEMALTAFLVEKNPASMIISQPDKKVGLHGVRTFSVNFLNATVPVKNVIGKLGQGNEILFKILRTFRCGMASATIGILKELFEKATEHIINTVRVDTPMAVLPLIGIRMAKIATTIYAMESASYFTAAILDSTENPDFDIEAAILKVFISEGAEYCIREFMNVIGSSTLLEHNQFEQYCRDIRVLGSFELTNDMARLYIGLQGCQYVGNEKLEHFRKTRNKFMFPFFTLKTNMKYEKVMKGKVKYTQDIAGHLHPSLVAAGNKLEELIQKFQVIVETALTNNGKNIVDNQTDLVTLADIAIYLYVTSAVLSRGSRSYCIGLKNSSQELMIVAAFCHDAFERIQASIDHIATGVYSNNNGKYLTISNYMQEWRGYYPQSPLTHNL